MVYDIYVFPRSVHRLSVSSGLGCAAMSAGDPSHLCLSSRPAQTLDTLRPRSSAMLYKATVQGNLSPMPKVFGRGVMRHGKP